MCAVVRRTMLAMPRSTRLVIHHHHGFLALLPPGGVTSFKSRGEGGAGHFCVAIQSMTIALICRSNECFLPARVKSVFLI